MDPKRKRGRGAKAEAGGSGTLFCWTPGGFTKLSASPDASRTETGFGSALGLSLRDQEAVIQQIKAGFPMSSFERLCQETSISASRLAVAAGIPLRTLGRRKEQGRLTLAESERVFRLATLFEKATQVLGDRENARQWIASPKKALGGRSPLEYADTEVGAREVEDLLGRLEHGVFS